MDLDELENKLKHINSVMPSAKTQTSNTQTSNTQASDPPPAPTSVTRKINSISEEDISNYSDKGIPSWNNLQALYEGRWQKEKEKFQTHLKANFAALVERYASGKQELFILSAPERREKLYVAAFLELFESGYAPHLGDVERIANKRVRKLFITLPHNYSNIY